MAAHELLLWLSSFFMVAFLLGLLVYQLMCLSDLEFDYINPFDLTIRINRVVLPEFTLHAGLALAFLLTGHWIVFLFNVPLLYFHFSLYWETQYLVDVTEVFNQLDYEKRYRIAKLIYYLFIFFIVIYRMLMDVI